MESQEAHCQGRSCQEGNTLPQSSPLPSVEDGGGGDGDDGEGGGVYQRCPQWYYVSVVAAGAGKRGVAGCTHHCKDCFDPNNSETVHNQLIIVVVSQLMQSTVV